jgi:glutamate N-acetyltransferase/amino-acid N-acetyltransferase
VIAVAMELAQAIIRDGEGASKFITVAVEGGRDRQECKRVGYASPIRRWSRRLSSLPIPIWAASWPPSVTPKSTSSTSTASESGWRAAVSEILVAEKGGRAASYREEDGARIMSEAEIAVRVDLGRGSARAAVYTCDLSSYDADYVM